MSRRIAVCIPALLFMLSATNSARADVVFTEEFANNTSGWVDNGFQALTFNANGGPDGSSYVSTEFDLGTGGSMGTSLFRAHDSFNASGDAFVRNFLADGIEEFSFSFRHSSPTPVSVFVRFATSNNFPASVTSFAALPQLAAVPGNNVWNQISIPIEPSSFVHEAGTFQSNFSSIGNIQIGTGTDSGVVTFGLDKVSLSVPEPNSMLLAGLALIPVMLRRRSK
ncbi:MAG: PEP-CTERM sorting domain-containing protein [Planctomycetota bacterium]|nr:PEP-CTERM sorting domain-containing protein [Planctomycetota bacterium]